MENSTPLWIRLHDTDTEPLIRAEALGNDRAWLLAIPPASPPAILDVVAYDPTTVRQETQGISYRFVKVVERSEYTSYAAWGVVHRPKELDRWVQDMAEVGIVMETGHWATRTVRQFRIALPPELSALTALARFARNAQRVELVSPTLAAAADDLDRAKADLDRAVDWGASDATLTRALAEAWQARGLLDEAVVFWERLTFMFPNDLTVLEHLAQNYADLGVFPHAAVVYDRASVVTESPEERERLEGLRDAMWEQAKV